MTVLIGRRSALLRGPMVRWLGLVAAVLIWEATTRQAGNHFFPPPSDIVTRMRELWLSGPASRLFLTDDAIDNILPSLGRMLLGFGLGAIIATGIGLALGRSARLHAYLDPALQFARSIPPPTLVPVFIVVFSVGTQMQLAAIMFSVVWPVLLNTADGARSVDPLQIDTARVFRLSPAQRLLHIIVPSALPKIFAGLRLALSLALILMVLSELMPGASNGIGYQLNFAATAFDIPAIWSTIVLLGILGYLFNTIFLGLEHRVLAWHRGSRQLAG